MPYQLRDTSHPAAPDQSGAVLLGATQPATHIYDLWPHQSLAKTGFVWFIGATALLLSLPLISVLGTPALWGLLPFLLLSLGSVWLALRRNQRDANLRETLEIQPASMTLLRIGPRGKQAFWQANPFWVSATLHKSGGPVPNYLTLRGNNREVELGAFLSEAERVALYDEVSVRLRTLR